MATNGTLMQYFHWYYGNTPNDPVLWEKVRQEAARLSALGVTALWLPPACKGGSKDDVGYGVYDLYDLGEFDQKGTIPTKYGTKDQYLAAIEAAHDHGIHIYADVVLNHKANADETEWVKASKIAWDNRHFVIEEDIWAEVWTKFTFPGRGNTYSPFKWDYRHFDGVDWAENLGQKAIFKFCGPGKEWEKMVSGEKGNYDYLMFSDIDMNHPEVRTELARWGKWYLDFTGVDGFRLDAIKHIQFSFFRDWLQFLRKVHPNLFAVGEYWSSDLNDLRFYLEKTHECMHLFDAPLQNNLYAASRDRHYDLRRIFDNTLVKDKPWLAVTLVDNHDTQPCQALERWVDWWFKPLAYALILLRQEGYPCVFYPDLYGTTYHDKGMDINLLPVQKLPELMQARALFAYGLQRDYFDHPRTIGWTRAGDDANPGSGMAVLLTNGEATSKRMEIGIQHAGKQLLDYLGNCEGTVTVDAEGWGEFRVGKESVSVWVVQ